MIPLKPTADLCDELGSAVAVCRPIFRSFGELDHFGGAVVTLRTFEDNTKVRTILAEPGRGRVLVVDGGGALTCGLLGGNLAKLAEENGWSGLVIHGCVRDAEEIDRCRIGVRALATHPRKSRKQDGGERDVEVSFAGVSFAPGARLVADRDGVVLLPAENLP